MSAIHAFVLTVVVAAVLNMDVHRDHRARKLDAKTRTTMQKLEYTFVEVSNTSTMGSKPSRDNAGTAPTRNYIASTQPPQLNHDSTVKRSVIAVVGFYIEFSSDAYVGILYAASIENETSAGQRYTGVSESMNKYTNGRHNRSAKKTKGLNM